MHPWWRVVAFAAGTALLVGCAGASSFERCVEHSVEEGVDRARVEAACEDAVGRD